MSFFIKCFKLFMNFIYSIFKLLKVQNKVTFISRQSDNISIDFQLLVQEINRQETNIKTVVLTKKLKKTFISRLMYFFHMFIQMYHIATSKVVVLDSYCIMISILNHRKELKIVQIWHALGSLKKFGYSSLDKNDGRSSKMAKLMNMHKNYTYILTSSEISKQFFKEAFKAKEEQMKVMSLPRVDFLQDEVSKKKVQERFYQIYPDANNQKKNILYCPTQRKNGTIDIQKIVKAVKFDCYNLIIKLHDGQEYVYVDNQNVCKNANFTGMELLHIADYIITDYSAIVYEAAIVEKPIYFYDYDYDTYMDDRGWYIDYKKEMPGPIKKDIYEIMKLIEEDKWNRQEVIDFKRKYIDDLSENATKNIVNLILDKNGVKRGVI